MTVFPLPKPPHPLTLAERDLIRRELGQRFSRFPPIAEGLFLRAWYGGPRAAPPKPSPVVRGMVERGLLDMRADPDGPWTRAYFTPDGLAVLRDLARDGRSLHPTRCALLRQELGPRASEEVNPATTAD